MSDEEILGSAPESDAIIEWVRYDQYEIEAYPFDLIDVAMPAGVESLYIADPRQVHKEYMVFDYAIYDYSLLNIDSDLVISRNEAGVPVDVDRVFYVVSSDIYRDADGDYYRGHRELIFRESDDNAGTLVSPGATVFAGGEFGQPISGGSYGVDVSEFVRFTRVSEEELWNIENNSQFLLNSGWRTDDGGLTFSPPGCFLAGTPIFMSDGSVKPIETIQPDDEVTSYDKSGKLVPGRVARTFQPRVKYVLDVHGLMVTPGHVTFCGDGKFAGQHVPMIDVLRSNGALVRENGSMVRACTNEPVGSDKDQFIEAIAGERQQDGSLVVREQGQIRLGTRYITDDGYDVSIADVIAAAGGIVSAEGLVVRPTATEGVPFLWPFGARLPRPEDYVLQRSALGLNDIYQAAEWETVPPRMPKPGAKDDAFPSPAGDATYPQ